MSALLASVPDTQGLAPAGLSARQKRAPQRIHLYLKHFPAAGAPLVVGTNKAVHGLAAGLVVNGMPTEVWCEGTEDSHCVVSEGYGVRCFATAARYMTFKLAESLKARLSSLQPGRDLFILNGIFHPSVFSLARELKARHIDYIVAPHGPYHPWLFRKNPHLKWPYWYLLERPLLRRALALQLLDQRHASWSERLGVTIPVVATPNGFLSADIIDDAQLNWRTSGRARILFWGRMDTHTKGIDVLLDGFDRIARTHELFLTLQGPDWRGELPRITQRIALLESAAQIKILPPEFDIGASRVMVEHDIVCLPSRFEGFGLSALEAMLAARVLLVSECAGIAPYIKASGCGVVVAPTPEAIARGFEELLARRAEWPQMGMAGREYALKHLHWNRIAAQALSQYQGLLN